MGLSLCIGSAHVQIPEVWSASAGLVLNRFSAYVLGRRSAERPFKKRAYSEQCGFRISITTQSLRCTHPTQYALRTRKFHILSDSLP